MSPELSNLTKTRELAVSPNRDDTQYKTLDSERKIDEIIKEISETLKGVNSDLSTDILDNVTNLSHSLKELFKLIQHYISSKSIFKDNFLIYAKLLQKYALKQLENLNVTFSTPPSIKQYLYLKNTQLYLVLLAHHINEVILLEKRRIYLQENSSLRQHLTTANL